MFVVSEPVYPRTKTEQAFLGLYGIAVLINFAALVITLANYVYRLDQTYTTFSGGTATLSSDLTVLLDGCSHNVTDMQIGGMGVFSFVDKNSAPLLFLSQTFIIVGVIVLMFFIFINDIFAKGCFGGNIRNWRIMGVTIPVNTIAANAMLVLSIGILILVGATSSSRSLLSDYVDKCTQQFAVKNFSAFIERENNVQTVFGIDLGLIVVAVSLNLAIYIFAFIAVCVEAFNKAAAEFEKRKYFWETNNFGVPDKRELFHYAKWREWALKALENDAPVELAPVSYLEWMQELENAKAQWGHDDPHHHHEKIPGLHDEERDGDYDDDDWQQQGGAVPVGAAAAPFNPWRVGGDDEPEELVMPEAFEDEGDYFVADEHDLPAHHQQRQPPPRGMSSDDMYSRAASFPHHGGAAMSPGQHPDDSNNNNNNNNVDRPFERRRSASASNNNSASHHHHHQNPYGVAAAYAAGEDPSRYRRPRAGESEEERRERHRQRRLNETAEERAARKERKRRVQELVTRGGSTGRSLPAPLPSP